MNIGKYAFPSEVIARQLILQYEGHTFVELGYLIKVQGVYDEEGNTIIEPIFSDKYSVDVMWYDLDNHPIEWIPYIVEVLDGMHMFYGCNYEYFKFNQ